MKDIHFYIVLYDFYSHLFLSKLDRKKKKKRARYNKGIPMARSSAWFVRFATTDTITTDRHRPSCFL